LTFHNNFDVMILTFHVIIIITFYDNFNILYDFKKF